MKIEFYRHNINKADMANVTTVLQSIFLTTGTVVNDFENKFGQYLNIKNVIGVTSCTAALHLCLLAWNIGEGDEVITTPMSFCATSNAILHAGAVPVFVDVEEKTGNINADLIESGITERTKAIIPVHLYGQMCDMKKIRALADKYNLVVIEDAAHCIEGMRDAIRVGQLGDAACFSFYATKNITSGEGGAIATDNVEKAKKLKILRLHGVDRSASERYSEQYRHWDMPELGWKYNMDNIQASLLIGQLERVEELLKKREDIYDQYHRVFSEVEGLKLIETLPDTKHARHLFTIHVDESERESILSDLQRHGIGVAVNYIPIHLLRYYREKFSYREGMFPVAETIGRRTVSLPFYPLLEDSEIQYITDTVIECCRHS